MTIFMLKNCADAQLYTHALKDTCPCVCSAVAVKLSIGYSINPIFRDRLEEAQQSDDAAPEIL